jgi:transcriptional regulator with XRE-family HTH domain
MHLHERIRKIREYRGLKQLSVAHEMNITQQAYSWLETRSSNIKLETLERFCGVMKIQLTFLMAEDIPVNAENMEIFQELNYSVIFEDYKRLRNRLQKYEDVSLKQAS